MPRYLLETTHPRREGPDDRVGLERLPSEQDLQVTLIFSFVGDERSFALFEGPHPEAIRHAARRRGLDIERLSEVRLVEPT